MLCSKSYFCLKDFPVECKKKKKKSVWAVYSERCLLMRDEDAGGG